ncbi:peroxiredoxin [Thioflexithrix psekupsensis]|uniref:thioredoxin-dependent peroxiredoxin n=1 Tax=Thioflexithrix psekupsensis TaxID=1570016 RepID=A0A251XC39_9GAMM|nr:peroxiredoxin [Thioflexithrix psekupsensis]OUD15717.1 peroxiredoxin [Thioflexithrix psekupsensis]
MQIGDSLPQLSLPATSGRTIDLSQLKGQVIVLYFYPRDDTPGCTQEGQEFRDLYPDFLQHQIRLFGVSRDTVKKHEQFRVKYDFPFDLISDEQELLCQHFKVIKPKNMFGKMVTGIERSTFLFDREGILRQEWRKVKVPEHAKIVLEAAKNIAAS